MVYTYYFVTLACGCKIRWNEFQPQPPKAGSKTYCNKHHNEVKIAEVERHSVDVEEDVEIESQ